MKRHAWLGMIMGVANSGSSDLVENGWLNTALCLSGLGISLFFGVFTTYI